MHTFQGKTCVIAHNADYSGNVIIKHTMHDDVEIAFADVLALVAEYVRQHRVEVLSNCSVYEVLGLPTPREEDADGAVTNSRHKIRTNGVLLAKLSRAERLVAKLLFSGMSTGEIAKTLHNSTYTIRNHIKAIYRKAEVHSIQELLAYYSEPVSK